MAAKRGDRTPEHSDNLCLHDMFKIVGNQLTPKDVRTLKGTYSLTSPELADESMQAKITDGFSFLLALEKFGVVDESNLKPLIHILSKFISRYDLIQFVTLRRRRTVSPDPVAQYLEETAVPSVLTPTKHKHKRKHHSSGDSTASDSSATHKELKQPSTVSYSDSTYSTQNQGIETTQSCVTRRACVNSLDGSLPPRKRPRTHQDSAQIRKVSRKKENSSSKDEHTDGDVEIKKKVTCDIRLRVRAEYCDHDNALEGNVFSNKPDPLERQFEKFEQANTILKSRDLGSIICDIKFSELTYLDAFWRDYINGSLLEALKGVFITESLKQAVGHEAIKLLVNVDEDDYEAGRLKLLENLKE